jgi:hypothetical protein
VSIAGAILAATDYTLVMNEPVPHHRLGPRPRARRSPPRHIMAFPPELVEVDHTHGYASVPDDVKGVPSSKPPAPIYLNPDITVVR